MSRPLSPERAAIAATLANDCARETAERFRGAGFKVAVAAIAVTDGTQQIGKGVWCDDTVIGDHMLVPPR